MTTNLSSPAHYSQRVLVVDDYKDGAFTLSMLVKLAGHDVRQATNGNDALRIAIEFSPTMILLDIGLPDVDGYEVAKQLRVRPETQDAMIVAVTGFGRDSDREAAILAGCDEHVTKPLELRKLNELLSMLPPKLRAVHASES